jgi:hypothetical protein
VKTASGFLARSIASSVSSSASPPHPSFGEISYTSFTWQEGETVLLGVRL